jgi:1-acyl-sn-glycerol-3-phosphate acyltransferase
LAPADSRAWYRPPAFGMNPLLKPALALYSVIPWTLAFTWMALVAMPGAAISRALGRPDWQRILVQWPMGLVPRFNFVRFKRSWHPDLQPRRVCVYAANHVNVYDASSACVALHGPFCGLMNAWQLGLPVYGWIMALTYGIPVASSPLERARTLPDLFRRRASQGLSILTFPEGHRTTTGKVNKFQRGVTQLARDADLPIAPLAVRGMFQVIQKGSLLALPFRRVDLWVGPQLETAGRSKKEMQRLTDALEEMVRAFVEGGHEPDVDAVLARHGLTRAGNSDPPA